MSIRIGVAGIVVAAAALAVFVANRGGGLSGEYVEVGGPGRLEFRGGKVYVGAPLGMTLVAGYEVDGDRVIIRGGGGAQVYTRRGDTLDAGMGMKFVKKGESSARTANGEQGK